MVKKSNTDPYGEKAAAARKGGRIQPNSGRFWSAKGDYVVGTDLFDRKETSKNSYSITKQVWNKISQEAYAIGKDPALEICFKSSGNPDITVVVIPEERYRELLRLSTATQEGAERPTVGEAMRNRQEKLESLLDSLAGGHRK